MNKSIISFLFILIFSLVFIIPLLHAQGLESTNENIDKQVENLEDIQNQIDDSPTDYLKQEWIKILEKNKVGQVLLPISDFFENLSPLFKIILGVEYSLSWSFVFAVVIWLCFFIFFFKLGKGIFPNNILIIFLLSLIISLLIGLSGAIRELVDLLAFIIKDPIAVVVAFIISLIIMLLIIKFSGGFGEYIRKQEEKLKKMKVEADTKLISSTAEGLREGVKSGKKK